MQDENEYPKAEEMIQTGETPPRFGSYSPRPTYLPENPEPMKVGGKQSI